MVAADLSASTHSDNSVMVQQDIHRKYQKDMHLMIDDLPMPDEDMTISSLSQSPWQGKSTRSYLSNLTSHRAMGSDPSEHLASGRNSVELSNHVAHQNTDSRGNLYSSHEDSRELAELDSERERKIGGNHGDSPDFNRAFQGSDADFSISRAGTDENSYKGPFGATDRSADNSNIVGGLLQNQNRTFADSVLDHAS